MLLIQIIMGTIIATIKSRYLSELFQQHGKTLLFAICIKLDFSVR
jgi:ABC-type thiamin/hydroxymethylpyrimidine transport system permease subunit